MYLSPIPKKVSFYRYEEEEEEEILKEDEKVEIANNMRQVALSLEGFNDTSCSQYSYRVVSHRGYHALGSRLITDKILISISFGTLQYLGSYYD